MLNKIFKLKENNSTISKEIIGGIVTFFTGMYMIFVNPIVLSEAGMNVDQAFISFCVTVFLSCLMVAFFTNLPLIIGPGLALSTIFVYDIVNNLGYHYTTALLTVFIAGAVSFIIFFTMSPKALINCIPNTFKVGITAGTGLFLMLIGFKLSGIIIPNISTMVKLGDIKTIPVIFVYLLFILLFICYHKKINFFPLATIGVFIFAAIINILILKDASTIQQTINALSFKDSSFHFFPLDFSHFKLALVGVIITLFLAATFDSLGTYFTYMNLRSNKTPAPSDKTLKRVMLIQGTSSMFASVIGATNTTIFLESTAGVRSGGKTGLVTLTVGILFLLSLFLKPLLNIIPGWSSGPVLLTVGSFMFITGIQKIDWSEYTEYFPAILVAIFIPLTYSITNGIALGLISYILVKFLSGKFKEIPLITFILGIIFIIYLLI